MVRRHVYDGERCIHCGVNIYDQWIYGAEDESDCNEREPMVHTSQDGPQDSYLDPEKRAALRAYADSLPAKHIDWAPPSDPALGLEHDGDEETT